MVDTQKGRDRLAVRLGLQFLEGLGKTYPPITASMLEKYFLVPQRPDSLEGVFETLVMCAQNMQMKPNVIGPIKRLGVVLFDFSPSETAGHYQAGDELFEAVKRKVKPEGKVREVPNAIWPLFCRTILAAATFMSRFATAKEFYDWVELFDCDDRCRAAIAIVLHNNIPGLGFALACNFLKDIGFENYGKPDVQIIKIFTSLGLSRSEDTYDVLMDIFRVAKHTGKTAYYVDKLFWLIGSGNFHLEEPPFRRPHQRDEFISFAKQRLDS